jgi:RNA recognition motif-containing protein
MPRNELFLGGLSRDTRRRDLEDIFERYGKLTRCDIKYVNGTEMFFFVRRRDATASQLS